MSRDSYRYLRSVARYAGRRYWKVAGDPDSTSHDRDTAYQWMRECEQRVPGGMLSSRIEDRVLLPGWYGRRCNVNQAIRQRKAACQRLAALSVMQRLFAIR